MYRVVFSELEIQQKYNINKISVLCIQKWRIQLIIIEKKKEVKLTIVLSDFISKTSRLLFSRPKLKKFETKLRSPLNFIWK